MVKYMWHLSLFKGLIDDLQQSPNVWLTEHLYIVNKPMQLKIYFSSYINIKEKVM
jgi:hypothetical protein